MHLLPSLKSCQMSSSEENMAFSEGLKTSEQNLREQLRPKVCAPLKLFPLNPIVNKSCKIECFGNKVHQIIQNMVLFQGLELKLSLL